MERIIMNHKTITVHIKLYSILREKLPAEVNGQADLAMPLGASVADLLDSLSIAHRVVVSVNDTHEPDLTRSLQAGDQVRVFSSVGGGACGGAYSGADSRQEVPNGFRL
jgi:sulfur carrier protein ThiS